MLKQSLCEDLAEYGFRIPKARKWFYYVAKTPDRSLYEVYLADEATKPESYFQSRPCPTMEELLEAFGVPVEIRAEIQDSVPMWKCSVGNPDADHSTFKRIDCVHSDLMECLAELGITFAQAHAIAASRFHYCIECGQRVDHDIAPEEE